MPRRLDEIQDKNDSIVRPVALQVVRQLMAMLNLPGGIEILFPGMWEEAINTGATINPKPTDDPAKFKYSRKFTIQVAEKAVEDRVIATAANRGDSRPVFVDEALEISIVPITVGTNMEITVIFRAESRAEAIRFRDDILLRFAEGRTDYLHEIDYHWNLPDQQVLLLDALCKTREANAGYGETLTEWVVPRISKRATDIATLIGTESKVAIREKQISPLGFFDFTATAEPEAKDREGKAVNVEFRYTFTYDQVVACVAQYPLMIHGQLIPDQWYSKPRASGHLMLPDRRLRAPTLSRGYFDVISNQGPNWEKLEYEMLRIPYFDDWSPKYAKPHTVEFFQVATAFDVSSPTDLFKIDDIDEFQFDPLILEFLRSEASRACRYKHSIFYFELFEDGNPLEDGYLQLTDDLEFKLLKPLDPRKLYHVQMRFFWHLMDLTQEALENLRASGRAGLMILEWLQIKLRGIVYMPDLIRDVYIPVVDLDRIGEILDGRIPRSPGEYVYPQIMKTVAQFSIISRRGPVNGTHPT